MYFEEKVIDGILYWRSSPHGEWTAYTLKELTEKLLELKSRCCENVR